MDHTPFIIAAYSVAALLLAWCALSPVIEGRRLRTKLRNIDEETESEHAPDA